MPRKTAANVHAMKILLVVFLLALAGCHSREDAGPFRAGLSTIEPVHTGIWSRLVDRKPVLLTFDDGPENLTVDRRILATLAKHHARALWLVTCKQLDPSIEPNALEHRLALREILANGNMIGNHGYSHVDLTKLDAPALTREIADCSDLIRKTTGVSPAYFRPPFGRHTSSVDKAIQADGMQLLLWGGNSFDSLFARFKQQPGTFAGYIAAHPIYDVALNAGPGDVLLFHDYPNTAIALDGILTRLEQRGFQFVLPQANASS